MTYNHCRFCDDHSQSLVRYGKRHYAHFKCYIEAGKSINDLQPWQVETFPYRLLKQHNLLDEAERIIKEREAALKAVS